MRNSLLKKLIIIALALCLAFTAIGCGGESEVYVTSVTSSGANALGESVFTVNYSDGSSDVFTLKNGKNGQDGADITINDIYQKYCVEVENVSYEDFLAIYMGSLTINTTEDLSKSIAKNLTSSLMLYAEFYEYNSSVVVDGKPFTINRNFEIGNALLAVRPNSTVVFNYTRNTTQSSWTQVFTSSMILAVE